MLRHGDGRTTLTQWCELMVRQVRAAAHSAGAIPLADDNKQQVYRSTDAGNETHIEYALSTLAGQAAVGFFGLLNCNMFAIHLDQLVMETRFLYSPDSTDPHPSKTLRLVRVLDVAISLVWCVFLFALAGGLYSTKLDVGTARTRLQTSILSVTVVYFIGAALDFVQCHYQAGGIGSQCHGFSCLQVAGASLLALVVMQVHARFFMAFSLTLESVYRLHWLSKQENSSSVHGIEVTCMVLAWVVFLAVYPIIMHYREIAQAAKGIACCKPSAPVLPTLAPSATTLAAEPQHSTSLTLVLPCIAAADVKVNIAVRVLEEYPHFGAADTRVCVMGDDGSAVARIKEDDSNLGAPASKHTTRPTLKSQMVSSDSGTDTTFGTPLSPVVSTPPIVEPAPVMQVNKAVAVKCGDSLVGPQVCLLCPSIVCKGECCSVC